MRQLKLVLILLSISITIAGAQSPALDTQTRVYWLDPATGLMWATKDNGKAITWHKAVSYCHNLRLADYSDWRLATVDELASLVEENDPAKQTGNSTTFTINLDRHVRGSLSLTGDPWSSSNRNIDRFGHPYGDGNFFDFIHSKPSGDLPYFRNKKYALCVRRP